MSTVTPTHPIESPTGPGSALSFVCPQGEQRTVFRGVSRQVYESLRDARTDGRHVRLAYDGSDLEITTVIGNIHEHWKELLSKIVSAVASWLNIDYMSCGQTTWQTAARGIEADLSYYFDAGKIRVAREALAQLKGPGRLSPPRPGDRDRHVSSTNRSPFHLWRPRRCGGLAIHRGPEADHRASPDRRLVRPGRSKPVLAH